MAEKLKFIATDWHPAVKRWGKGTTCPDTGEVGNAIYFIDEGTDVNLPATDGKSTITSFKSRPKIDGKRVQVADEQVDYLLIHGGREQYSKSPDTAYINMNPNYVGGRLLTTDAYEQLCKERGIVVESIPSPLDRYIS